MYTYTHTHTHTWGKGHMALGVLRTHTHRVRGTWPQGLSGHTQMHTQGEGRTAPRGVWSGPSPYPEFLHRQQVGRAHCEHPYRSPGLPVGLQLLSRAESYYISAMPPTLEFDLFSHMTALSFPEMKFL